MIFCMQKLPEYSYQSHPTINGSHIAIQRYKLSKWGTRKISQKPKLTKMKKIKKNPPHHHNIQLRQLIFIYIIHINSLNWSSKKNLENFQKHSPQEGFCGFLDFFTKFPSPPIHHQTIWLTDMNFCMQIVLNVIFQRPPCKFRSHSANQRYSSDIVVNSCKIP